MWLAKPTIYMLGVVAMPDPVQPIDGILLINTYESAFDVGRSYSYMRGVQKIDDYRYKNAG